MDRTVAPVLGVVLGGASETGPSPSDVLRRTQAELAAQREASDRARSALLHIAMRLIQPVSDDDRRHLARLAVEAAVEGSPIP